MALQKKIKSMGHEHAPDASTPQAYGDLLTELCTGHAADRRAAARHLAAHPSASDKLVSALLAEPDHPVREAIFSSLQEIGGEGVVGGLLPLLRSEEADIRNGAIEVLCSMPDGVASHMVSLLNDQDSDVRIFAIDILQVLAHSETPKWLLSVLKDEQHVNVVATAVDRLAEVGTPEMIPDLEAMKQRFADEPYLTFAVDTAIRRIGGV